MPREASLSTAIDPTVKKALASYAKKRGLKIRFVVEQAIVELIEDESDMSLWRQRREEPTVAWDDVVRAHQGAPGR
jgi:hypothetical protein